MNQAAPPEAPARPRRGVHPLVLAMRIGCPLALWLAVIWVPHTALGSVFWMTVDDAIANARELSAKGGLRLTHVHWGLYALQLAIPIGGIVLTEVLNAVTKRNPPAQ